ncbi:hypothetical protein [Nocardia sp. NPDC050718]|uniref:hypothetical protein n=1 Tax=Nocardia sp. NPDC050718 TaxID=3155788 RepID=UPI0033F52E1D
MNDHVQMQPPDYHRCLETVFRSPVACHTLLQQLSEMTEDDIRSRWSPWLGQQPPPSGPQVEEQVPAEVRVAMLQAVADRYLALIERQHRELAAVLDIPVMQHSYVELIEAARRILASQRDRIAELEAAVDLERSGE